MKSAFILASPRVRAHLRRCRMRDRLRDWSLEAREPEDLGYLYLAELLITGADHRELPDDEKADCLIA